MRVIGIRSAASVGVARYSARLAEALGQEGVGYELASAPRHRSHAHWHLANSSRSVGWQACAYRAPFVVTVHDVLPRTDALMPVYRHWLYPIVRRAARVVVHSDYAADLLVERAGVDPRRLRKIPHPAAPLPPLARAAARRELGWPQERLIALLPGVIKPAKLVREAAVATQPLAASQGWQLALAGDVLDRNAAREARAGGALVLESPDDATYACALAAADAVLVLRAGSVGETNGPLLDAFGAGRAVLASATGSIPEVADDAAHLCPPTVDGIRAGLGRLTDATVRAGLEERAAARRDVLSWRASAGAHAALFTEVFDG